MTDTDEPSAAQPQPNGFRVSGSGYRVPQSINRVCRVCRVYRVCRAFADSSVSDSLVFTGTSAVIDREVRSLIFCEKIDEGTDSSTDWHDGGCKRPR